jgi:hypothetical protein
MDDIGAAINQLADDLDRILDEHGLSLDEKAKVCETIIRIAQLLAQQSAPPDPAELARRLSDPRAWARAALESPEMVRLLEDHESPPGSVAEWLKRAIAEEKSRRGAGNVVDIESRRDRS